MKAMTFLEPGKMELIDISKPEMGPEDVLIDIRYVGLCGTDLNTYRGKMPFVSYPLIPGHEVSGVVQEKGAQVPDTVAEGDKVTILPYFPCGDCPACHKGRFNTCQRNQTLGVHRDGALTSSIAVPWSKVFSSCELHLTELALAEPMAVGYHATNRGRVVPGDRVLVLGCGTIGMGATSAAVFKGATVMAVDVNEAKLELVRKFGVEATINAATDEIEEKVVDLTGGDGADVVIEAVGHPDTIRWAVEAASYTGRVVHIGYFKKELPGYDINQIVVKELDVTGSRNALNVFPEVIRMLEQGQLPFQELISARYPFSQAPEAFKAWDADPGKFTKILIDMKA
ncbi:MAG: zinc-binding alcohol dehydrogenase family protein [Fidelibacterota bacterium]|nr:MAG: zinc-binding alcohol dehydrogenase family protein [Candidatus Neomarinimicrobiota bacterium]